MGELLTFGVAAVSFVCQIVLRTLIVLFSGVAMLLVLMTGACLIAIFWLGGVAGIDYNANE
jgi:hypothetical protein